MKRWAVALLVVLALAGGAVYWFVNSLDFVVKTAIERFGPDIVGVAVVVGEVKIDATAGRGALRGIEIANPPGYSSPTALRAASVSVGLEPASLGRDVVVITDILVDGPEISYELKGGTNNIEAIRRNIEGYVKRAGGEGETGPASKPAPGRRYAIGRITLRGARVTMTNPLLKGGGLVFNLPDVDLRDVGTRERGVTAAQAASAVANALVSRIAQRVLTNLDALKKGGVEGAIDALRGLIR